MKEISKIIKKSIRNEDFAIRFGGEEFLIFLFNIDPLNAIKKASNIKDEFANKIFTYENESFTKTLSIGIAKANAAKWTQMATILNPENKWIVIVQDADDFWWSFGYRFGARISLHQFKTGLRGEDDGYSLEIQGIENNKILTAIDEDYVKNFVI